MLVIIDLEYVSAFNEIHSIVPILHYCTEGHLAHPVHVSSWTTRINPTHLTLLIRSTHLPRERFSRKMHHPIYEIHTKYEIYEIHN